MKTLRATQKAIWDRKEQPLFQPDRYFLSLVKTIENLGTLFPAFGWIYTKLFYQSMLEKEIVLSGIVPGMKVIHIGCGPLPMTAVHLAEFGAQVTAVDMQDSILKQAAQFINRRQLCDRINLLKGCGTSFDFSGYDAIWFSLHVNPITKVIQRACRSMDTDARIIFRAPRGKLSWFYTSIDKQFLPPTVSLKTIRQPLGKMSIMLKKA